ncbi:hypothetical protein [Staphylococcus epidermidis]|uniref:hypothetical protein n=1 Tax=Staphylococcus epidermidis TaxID=1282 RepID=UPI0020B305E4|nr:hypothetical protein [Staphylococcus epidermidis]UTF87615.1 hypothetical protein MNU32_13185 [Staphylococcus epidermidis]
MKIIISIIVFLIIIALVLFLTRFLIKEKRIEIILRKFLNLGFSVDEINERGIYLTKQSNKKLKEIIKEVNRKEKEEIPIINEENFFDPLFKTQNKSRLFTAIDPKGNFMVYDKYGNLLEHLNIYQKMTKLKYLAVY